MKLISSPDSPTSAGHYSSAVVHNGVVYVSGQLPRVPGKPPDFAPATIEEQTRQALHNAEAVLLMAGSHRDLVLRSTLYGLVEIRMIFSGTSRFLRYRVLMLHFFR